jgi:hypothetical protein
VANKEELLGGMVDVVFGEIDPPRDDEGWEAALRRRALSTRAALTRHRWAIGLMESASPGPANLRSHDAVMGCLRRAGFSFESAIHAYSVQDAYIYGFALQERDLGFEHPGDAGRAVTRRARAHSLENYPYLAEIAAKLPTTGYDPDREFAWGLDLILRGLDGLREETKPPLPDGRRVARGAGR